MSIQHNIRMFFLKRKSDYLIKHASRQYTQSAEMIDESPQREPDYGLGVVWVVAVIAMVAVVAVVNIYQQDIGSAVSCYLIGK